MKMFFKGLLFMALAVSTFGIALFLAAMPERNGISVTFSFILAWATYGLFTEAVGYWRKI